jgi:hypothetical protein
MQGNWDVTASCDELCKDLVLVTVFGPWCGLLARYYCPTQHVDAVLARAKSSYPNEEVDAYSPWDWECERSQIR